MDTNRIESPDPGLQVHPKQRLSSQERRAAIVDAALHLFAEKGFRGTTTRELAARVGVSEPVLYEHFKTKRDLYTAIIDRVSQESPEELASVVEQFLHSHDDRGFFLMLAHRILHWHTSNPAFFKLLLFSGLEGHELKDLFYERQTVALFGLISRYIEQRMKQGAMRCMNPEVAARTFFGMVSQYSLARLVFTTCVMKVPEEEVLATQVDIFLNGVSAVSHAEVNGSPVPAEEL